jgi:hypothetical protein
MSAYSNNHSAERLAQLSEEVNRIAGTLARLSTEAAPVFKETGGLPEVSAGQVLAVIRGRRLRARYFPSEIFADPAWDMMLTLLHSELSQRRLAVSHLTAASDVPATTALRWINALVKKGLLVRNEDPFDGRRVFIELSSDASTALRQYFAELGPVATI